MKTSHPIRSNTILLATSCAMLIGGAAHAQSSVSTGLPSDSRVSVGRSGEAVALTTNGDLNITGCLRINGVPVQGLGQCAASVPSAGNSCGNTAPSGTPVSVQLVPTPLAIATINSPTPLSIPVPAGIASTTGSAPATTTPNASFPAADFPPPVEQTAAVAPSPVPATATSPSTLQKISQDFNTLKTDAEARLRKDIESLREQIRQMTGKTGQ
jgi:hypothetical protein